MGYVNTALCAYSKCGLYFLLSSGMYKVNNPYSVSRVTQLASIPDPIGYIALTCTISTHKLDHSTLLFSPHR